MLRSFGQGEVDSERGSCTRFAPAHEYAPHMVLLDNTFGQSQPKSPSALLGGIAGVEHRLVVFTRNPFPRVGYGYMGFVTFLPAAS